MAGQSFVRSGAYFLLPSQLGFTRVGHFNMSKSDGSDFEGRREKRALTNYRVPNVVAPNNAFCVEGCERQYCGGASTVPPSSAAACQPQRGS